MAVGPASQIPILPVSIPSLQGLHCVDFETDVDFWAAATLSFPPLPFHSFYTFFLFGHNSILTLRKTLKHLTSRYCYLGATQIRRSASFYSIAFLVCF